MTRSVPQRWAAWLAGWMSSWRTPNGSVTHLTLREGPLPLWAPKKVVIFIASSGVPPKKAAVLSVNRTGIGALSATAVGRKYKKENNKKMEESHRCNENGSSQL
jgi:hypothetical protein